MLTLGSITTISTIAIGVVVLQFQDNKNLILSGVLYVPLMRCNLILVAELSNKGYSFTFGTEVVIRRNGSFICSGIKSNGLYVITPSVSNKSMMELNNSMVTLPTKRNEPSSNPTRLWHMRLGHINLNRINRLVKEGILGNLVIQPMEVCESCLKGKMTKKPLYGLINIRARGGYEYFITFTYDHSRYGYV